MYSHLPFAVDATGFSLVEAGLGVMRVEANDKGGDSERPDPSRLRVFLQRRSTGVRLKVKVLTCWTVAICLVMYSTVTGSSTTNL